MKDKAREKAEGYASEIKKIEIKITKLFADGFIPDLEKVEKLYKQRTELNARMLEIYELLGLEIIE